jgi:prepilin-type N-terminal cleavage/methylation domain-containing protein
MFFNIFKKKKDDSEEKWLSKKAFTLIEIIVVVFIILTLSVIVVFNYEWGGYQITLSQSANKLAQNFRKAEGMAQSYTEIEGNVPKGYGLNFNLAENTHYIIFGDMDGDGLYNPAAGDFEIEDIALEEGVEISACEIDTGGMSEPPGFGGADVNIVFEPPDPVVSIKDQSGGTATTAVITLRSAKTDDTIRVHVNILGLIQVQEIVPSD